MNDADIIKSAAVHPGYHHATARRWCGVDQIYFYASEPGSPTGVIYLSGVADNPTNRAIMASLGMARPGSIE